MRLRVAFFCLGLAAAPIHAETRSLERDLPAFEILETELPTEVVWEPGAKAHLMAQGDAALMDRLEIHSEAGRLRLRLREGSRLLHNPQLKVRVVSPGLQEARLAGSGELELRRYAGPLLKAALAGSGDLKLVELKARRLEAKLSGSGDLDGQGEVESLDVSLAGSGDIRLAGLKAREAEASLAGSGDIELQASQRVKLRCNGSGDIRVHGQPPQRDAQTAGTCDIRYVP